jgi:hypothetical protein
LTQSVFSNREIIYTYKFILQWFFLNFIAVEN